jgi:hypothetical protein
MASRLACPFGLIALLSALASPAPAQGPLDEPPARDFAPLNRPVAPPAPAPEFDVYNSPDHFVIHRDPPPGFTGRSSVLPSVLQADAHFLPVEDRWRLGFPEWDRYGKRHPFLDDYPFDVGAWYNPYKQNVLKGDYPILGQNTFLDITATSFTLAEPRQVPTGTTPFESTANPHQFEFFGSPNQFVYLEYAAVSLDLFHGDAAFKPVDWRIKLTPVFNSNNIAVDELAVINPDVRKGVQRERTFFALQEWFVEKKLADLSPHYDFVSARVGSQFFVSDFRGFVFSDTNRAVRLFGTLESNRDQFNLACFLQQEKDTNSGLNSFNETRAQQVVIANFYRQDFIWPGYTAQLSFLYNHDAPTFHFDRNNFLVRPDPVGVFQPHELNVFYLGFNGDGHINRINVTHAFYWALGHDSLNPLANTPQDISAFMGAIELSYDRDYARFRTSYFVASGDRDPNSRVATGFDSILDMPTFAGTFFSYWGRQRIGLFGVGLKQNLSLIPNLRSSKIQGQSNFVNPGLHLVNLGFDLDLTPKLKLITNTNFLWFDQTAPLETFLFQGAIDQFIGADLSLGVEYRPLLNNNVQMLFGLATLIPGQGFRDLYDRLDHSATALVSGFAQVVLAF